MSAIGRDSNCSIGGWRRRDRRSNLRRPRRSLGALQRLTNIVSPPPAARFLSSAPKVVAAVDVQNPLLGKGGATRVFGPQKGVQPDQVVMLEGALQRLADVVTKEFQTDFRNKPGA